MENRLPFIAGNWKMYKTVHEAEATAKQLVSMLPSPLSVEVMIAPPFVALATVAEAIAGSAIALGAQNMHWHAEGAYTGEVSAGMLAAVGCRYVILGHSERRQYFGETDETVNRKLHAALGTGLRAIVCVGESGKQREDGKTFSVLDKQIEIGLKGLSLDDASNAVIAYEPIWAIGTGKTATSQQAQEVHRYLRQRLAETFGESKAEAIRILYGGSVKPGNISELMAMPDVDGALVGGASLESETFSKIVCYNR